MARLRLTAGEVLSEPNCYDPDCFHVIHTVSVPDGQQNKSDVNVCSSKNLGAVE
jgi:hypothetical protein